MKPLIKVALYAPWELFRNDSKCWYKCINFSTNYIVTRFRTLCAVYYDLLVKTFVGFKEQHNGETDFISILTVKKMKTLPSLFLEVQNEWLPEYLNKVVWKDIYDQFLSVSVTNLNWLVMKMLTMQTQELCCFSGRL